MDWVRDFYSKQTLWLGLEERWARISVDGLRGRPVNRAAAIERFAGSGAKRVLELGCGSGIVAGAMVSAGHTVVAVDLIDERVANAQRIAGHFPQGKLEVLQGDFYEIELTGLFDVVCYFDGFGIGSDADQRRLLERIAAWMKPDGCALIDVYSPFAERVGEVVEDFDALSRTTFDAESCRLVNSIWPKEGDESEAVAQSLRCYSVLDFQLLLEGTGLSLEMVEPYRSADHDVVVPMDQAMLYLSKLIPT